MSVYADSINYEYYDGSGWVDLAPYVINDVNITRGINGWSPVDRVASVGTMKFQLKNVGNIFTPGHASCWTGFEEGAKIRLRIVHHGEDRYRFYGRIALGGIQISTSPWLTTTSVVVEDYMGQMMKHELQLPTFTTNKRIDEIIPLIIANMPIAPMFISPSYKGQSTFDAVFDTVRAKTTSLSEAAKVALSELGYVFIRISALSSVTTEMLVSEGRYSRNNRAVTGIYVWNGASFDFVSAIFDNSMRAVQISHGKNYYNEVKTSVTPRQVDSTPQVLFNLEKPIWISEGGSITIKGTYRDPDQEATAVSGINMVTPVASTDYKMNRMADGKGVDMTALYSVTATYGTNQVKYVITNTGVADDGSGGGYVWFLQARGYGVYNYNAVQHSTEDAALIATDGRITLDLQFKYEDDPLVALDFEKALLDRYKVKYTVIEKVSFVANRSEFLMGAALCLDISDKITLEVDSVAMSENYFIHSIDMVISPGGVIRYSYGLKHEDLCTTENYWLIGATIAGGYAGDYSKIGVSTILGF